MQNELINKETNERLLFRNLEIPTTLLSNNPFESTQALMIEGQFNRFGKKAHILKRMEDLEIYSPQSDRLKHVIKSVKKDPNNPYLINNLGLVYLNNKEIDKAKKCFLRALEIDKNLRITQLNLAALYKLSGHFEEARAIYFDLLNLNPSDKGVKINLANLFLYSQKFDDAEKLLSDVWNKSKNDTDVANKLAIIFLIKNQFQKSISFLRQGLRIDPNSSTLYNTLGVAYAASNSIKKAVKSFKSALNIAPTYHFAEINLAAILLQEKKLNDAIESLEQFLYRYYNDEVEELLAKCYLLNKEYKRSLIILSQILYLAKNKPGNDLELARLNNNIGVVYHNMGEHEKAENHYLEALSLGQFESVVTVTNIIELYFARYNFISAKSYIDLLKEKFPNEKIQLFYDAVYDTNLGKTSNAIGKLEKYLQFNKLFAPAYGLLSYIYSEHLSDFEKSISILTEAIQFIPNNKIVLNNLAYNYLMLDNVEEARKILNEIDDVSDIYLTATRGLLAIKEGNLEEGRRLYNLAARISSDEYLKTKVYHKKDLELAKYYLKKNLVDKAKETLDKFVKSRSSGTIHKDQAMKLYESLF